MKMQSKYKIYQELVYSVVKRALVSRNIDEAIEKTMSYEIFTRSEILDIACVEMESYVSDCIVLYIKELEHKLSSAEYQLSRITEKLKSDGIELFEGMRNFKMNEDRILIVIRIIDHSAGSEGFSYAVIATDIEKAGNLALQIHAKENNTEEKYLEVDSDGSFEISCASDAQEELFYINLTKKSTH